MEKKSEEDITAILANQLFILKCDVRWLMNHVMELERKINEGKLLELPEGKDER